MRTGTPTLYALTERRMSNVFSKELHALVSFQYLAFMLLTEPNNCEQVMILFTLIEHLSF